MCVDFCAGIRLTRCKYFATVKWRPGSRNRVGSGGNKKEAHGLSLFEFALKTSRHSRRTHTCCLHTQDCDEQSRNVVAEEFSGACARRGCRRDAQEYCSKDRLVKEESLSVTFLGTSCQKMDVPGRPLMIICEGARLFYLVE